MRAMKNRQHRDISKIEQNKPKLNTENKKDKQKGPQKKTGVNPGAREKYAVSVSCQTRTVFLNVKFSM
jgi:hypothetical protein